MAPRDSDVVGAGGTLHLRFGVTPDDGRVDGMRLTGAQFVTIDMQAQSDLDSEFQPSQSDVGSMELTDRPSVSFENAPPATYSRVAMNFADVELEFELLDDRTLTVDVGPVMSEARCGSVELRARGEAWLEVDLRLSEVVEEIQGRIPGDDSDTIRIDDADDLGGAVAAALEAEAWHCERDDDSR